ncbi:triose-phosphate isomerase [Asticcacaulis biprosthecium C19]|uniref:Triosephosphate isomerase n=1 Tax=Asticcacaulis biprosthecium C19 TaxID=715226 RepID=F4QQN9_9CAUL|nr:triose-phosphate isomerase [Asticcacaulis biprosthecium]EGF90526.1 triose-phosphate isomerase [Asticcacaulis biprosthecium C19]
MPQRHLIAANWKMNGLKAALPVAEAIADIARNHTSEVVIFPPATLLAPMQKVLEGSPVKLGGQDCHYMDGGAYTGDISAAQLKDAGASMVILGHSERRHGHLEPCELVARKVRTALRAGLTPIICIGETLDQRKAGKTVDILTKQLKDSLPDELEGQEFHVSYEPVWAIGTGMIASDAQICEAIALVRTWLDNRFPAATPKLLYGGSVKPSNAAHVLKLSGVGGALVGGASLTVDEFAPIIAAGD